MDSGPSEEKADAAGRPGPLGVGSLLPSLFQTGEGGTQVRGGLCGRQGPGSIGPAVMMERS